MKHIILLIITSLMGCASPGYLGVQYSALTHKVEYVFPNSPAEKLGIKPGDTLVKLPDGHVGDKVKIMVSRKDETSKKDVLTIFDNVELVCKDDLRYKSLYWGERL